MLFSDRYRPVVVLCLAFALGALAWSWVAIPAATPAVYACWKAPQTCAGQAHALTLVRVEERLGPDRVRVRSHTSTLRVDMRGFSAEPGQILTLEGTFDADGLFLAQTVRAHPWRRLKWALGLVGLLGLGVLLPAVFTVAKRPEGVRVVPRWGGERA